MGYGAYSHKAHEALTAARGGLASEKLFVQRECHPRMSPFGVKKRESRDSEAHPRSLGIVFALDVTGSMGAIPTTLAQRDPDHARPARAAAAHEGPGRGLGS
jgi:hypothetical protein